jgi:hypothetical protein
VHLRQHWSAQIKNDTRLKHLSEQWILTADSGFFLYHEKKYLRFNQYHASESFFTSEIVE